ncbi:MAG TPA: Hsp70 family protein [Polyangiaceae bacterium]|nr:Hsp70 family protein [Polyangiaceae bacterium]
MSGAPSSLPLGVVGIDLGTSHTALGWSPVGAAAGPIQLQIAQWVAGRRRAAQPLLPSVLYAPVPGEMPEEEGGAQPDWLVGEYARVRSQETRGRAITSAKSWLCHPGVDRLGPILPWGASELGTAPKLSPVEASRRLLEYVRAQLQAQHPELELARLSVVLTVPASFDQTARKLTLLAAERAQLRVRLLEEPQAAFYEYIGRSLAEIESLARWRGPLRVLICDVGGGTTDLSLIEVTPRAGELEFRRSAVGRHLLLGGDNMDLAVARRAESKAGGTPLEPERFGQLLLAARSAKEQLLAAQAPATLPIRLLGAGAELFAGGWSTELARGEVQELVLDGFFPLTAAGELPSGRRSGITAFGLPYERDPAITRHIAEFIARQAGGQLPDALLLNGGVMQSELVQQRLLEVFQRWGARDLTLLSAPDPMLAVCRGAVRFGLALLGQGPRIVGGAAHGYYIGVASAAGERQALCLVPRGSKEGERHQLGEQRFELLLGRPARFEVYASDTALHAPGERVEIDADYQRLPPVTAELALPAGATEARAEVQLDGELSAVGTLELGCTLLGAAGEGAAPRRFSLAFELSPAPSAPVAKRAPSSRGAPSADTVRFQEAEESLARVFGKGRKDVPEREVKDLRNSLERTLGPRKNWDLELSRRLADRLLSLQKGRTRSEEHERGFWMLLGYCLRPGFGHALDAQRIAQLWPAFDAGLSHRESERNWQQYWIAWRRLAGGLDEGMQHRIRELADPFLAPAELKLKKPKGFRPLALDELLALASQLERVEPEAKSELGRWLLERTWHDRDPRLWAYLGRLGARVPAYASAHYALKGGTVERWVEQLLRERWSEVNTAAACGLSLARLTGDQVRDLALRWRSEVAAALGKVGAPEAWQRAVLELTPLSEADRVEQFGEDLPLGLRLL